MMDNVIWTYKVFISPHMSPLSTSTSATFGFAAFQVQKERERFGALVFS